jgi:hypothetical protein
MTDSLTVLERRKGPQSHSDTVSGPSPDPWESDILDSVAFSSLPRGKLVGDLQEIWELPGSLSYLHVAESASHPQGVCGASPQVLSRKALLLSAKPSTSHLRWVMRAAVTIAVQERRSSFMAM